MNEELTRIEELLIAGLKVFGVSMRGATLIFVMLEEEQKGEMIDYMLEHPKATEEELLRKAYEIAG